jgi:uncharacterized RDD family membrane protein YckC
VGTIIVVSEIQVLVPEKVVVSYRLAATGVRIAAHLLDTLFVFISIFATTYFVGVVMPNSLGMAFLTVFITFGYFVYFMVFEWLWNGKTPGKHLCSLRVRMADGTPIVPLAAFYRNLIRFADFFPVLYFTGLMSMFMNQNSQRMGDLVAGTIVVTDKPTRAQNFTAPHNLGVHPLEPLIGDLRQMTRAEYVLLKQIADRFPSMPEGARKLSLEEVWTPFAEKHKIGEPPVGVHSIYMIEAVVMKYGRSRGLL